MPERGKSTSALTRAVAWIPRPGDRIQIQAPAAGEAGTLNACLAARRSVRNYEPAPVTLAQVSQLIWAAQGVTGLGGLRTSPSAGAIYPLTAYLIASNVEGLLPGIYRYEPDAGELAFIEKGERRKRLCVAAMGQECVLSSPMALLLVSWEKRVRAEFGDYAEKLISMECGHAAQNFLLEAVSLRLGAIGLAKFDIDAMRAAVPIRSDEKPEYLLLAGYPAGRQA
jgi:SagB-type dehydrogenase family enzyme